MKRITKLSWLNRVTLLALLLVGLTNPWSVGYIGAGIDTAMVYFTLYANYVFVAGLVLLGGANLYSMYTGREKLNIPAKTAKTKPAKFLETN